MSLLSDQKKFTSKTTRNKKLTEKIFTVSKITHNRVFANTNGPPVSFSIFTIWSETVRNDFPGLTEADQAHRKDKYMMNKRKFIVI